MARRAVSAGRVLAMVVVATAAVLPGCGRDDADTAGEAERAAARVDAPATTERRAERSPPEPVAARGDSPPLPIPATAVPPAFPLEAVRRDESGTVLLRIPVDAEGVAGTVSLQRSSGSRILDQAAIDAVSRWRFEPARADGRAVAGVAEVPIEFRPAD
jgi:protein TonB